MNQNFYNSQLAYSEMFLAIVMKNEMPYIGKILLFHEKYGKIWCVFDKNHQAALLHTGSIIHCQVAKDRKYYRFIHMEIESILHANDVIFVHDIMKICIILVPEQVIASELFDFLKYVFYHLDHLTQQAKLIVLLRLFLMCDFFECDSKVYQIAMSDPLQVQECDQQYLLSAIKQCWDLFYKKKS